MQLPTVEDVNVTRLARFDDAITEALAGRGGRRSSATSSPTTSASTTCPRSTSPPRSPSCSRATRRCCSSPEPSVRPAPDASDRGGPARARRPAASAAGARRARQRPRRGHGDVPDRRRQAAQGRAAPDRRRHRQRGRPEPQRLRRDQHPPGLLARRAARRAAAGHRGGAGQHPHLRQADRPAPRPGAARRTDDRGPDSFKKKPRTKNR